jgi:aerobic carbon-monoxide dehydrogenase medium subunit
MKPARFDYERPADLAGALALLGRSDVETKALAGCQSLGPMLNLRVAQPGLLVDITRLAETRRVETDDDGVTLGACVTHAAIEDGRLPDPTNGMLRAVAAGIAYRAVRNRGTIGGSLAHADPAADWPSALAALGAEALVVGPGGRRTVAVAALAVGIFTTTLEPSELIEAVRVPRLSRAARWGYYKLTRKAGEFAHAIAAVVRDPERAVMRAVIGAAGGAPIVIADASALLDDAAAIAAVIDAAPFAHDPYERQIPLFALERALQQVM